MVVELRYVTASTATFKPGTLESTVKFTFSDPRIQEFENWLYENAIVPKHIWESRSEADITTTANEKPIGTGPYEYLTHDQDRMVWKKKANWFKEPEMRKALSAVIADKKTYWMARTGAIESLVALGASKAELEALKKGYDEKNLDDKSVLKKLDEAINKAK